MKTIKENWKVMLIVAAGIVCVWSAKLSEPSFRS